MPFLTRRGFLAASGSTFAMLGARSAFAQQPRLKLEPTEFQPIPIAIPNFVAGSPADAEVGAGVTGVITNNLQAQRAVRADRSGRLHREASPTSTPRRNSPELEAPSTPRRWSPGA